MDGKLMVWQLSGGGANRDMTGGMCLWTGGARYSPHHLFKVYKKPSDILAYSLPLQQCNIPKFVLAIFKRLISYILGNLLLTNVRAALVE